MRAHAHRPHSFWFGLRAGSSFHVQFVNRREELCNDRVGPWSTPPSSTIGRIYTPEMAPSGGDNQDAIWIVAESIDWYGALGGNGVVCRLNHQQRNRHLRNHLG